MLITPTTMIQTSWGNIPAKNLEKKNLFFLVVVPKNNAFWEAGFLKKKISTVENESTQNVKNFFYKFKMEKWGRHSANSDELLQMVDRDPLVTYHRFAEYFLKNSKLTVALKLFIKCQDYRKAALITKSWGELSKTMTFCNMALIKDPLDSLANSISGSILMEGFESIKSNPAEGFKRLQKSLTGNFDNDNLLTVARHICMDPTLGKFYEAETHCNLVLEQSPSKEQEAEANFLLAYIYAYPNDDLNPNFSKARVHLCSSFDYLYLHAEHPSRLLSARLLSSETFAENQLQAILTAFIVTYMTFRGDKKEAINLFHSKSKNDLLQSVYRQHYNTILKILSVGNWERVRVFLSDEINSLLNKMDNTSIADCYNRGGSYQQYRVGTFLDKLDETRADAIRNMITNNE